MEMAGWIRLGVLVAVALIVVAFLLRPKKKPRRTQRGDAPENPYTMSGPPNDGV